jgi:arginyl-tRNA synthetase
MSTCRQILTQRLILAFEKAGIIPPEGVPITVVQASDTRFGDYQSNAAMVVAKALKTNPRQLAATLVENVDVSDLCDAPEIAGPGFLNFRLSKASLAKTLGLLLEDERNGVSEVEEARRIVIDFSAPNVAKPMHVGHIRSTFIGDSLARIARFVGHHVITDNHVGDWGTQFGMILHGFKNLLDHEALAKDPIHELVRVYRAVNALTKADESVLEVCKLELVKLQNGDAENLEIWRRCVKLTLDQLNEVYERLGIHFDHYLGESFYNEALAPLVEELLAKGIARISDGAACIFSDETQPPNQDPFKTQRDGQWADAPCIVRKSDGGFLYATTDLATIDFRVREWKADEIWYVVGAPQQLHFRQIFAASARRGQGTRMEHIAFGSILGPDGKMFKTRSGESVGLLEVIDEAVDRAKVIVDERDLDEASKTQIAEAIGIAAVKYAELSQHRMTDYKFSWEKMLSFQGNTAPYLINAYVRIRGIFRKLGDAAPKLDSECEITEEAERALTVKLRQFGEAVHDVLEQDFRPSLLAQYLYELADTFHGFYESCPVLRSEGTVRNTRLVLCEVTSKVLKQGLDLLGIKTTERM